MNRSITESSLKKQKNRCLKKDGKKRGFMSWDGQTDARKAKRDANRLPQAVLSHPAASSHMWFLNT